MQHGLLLVVAEVLIIDPEGTPDSESQAYGPFLTKIDADHYCKEMMDKDGVIVAEVVELRTPK